MAGKGNPKNLMPPWPKGVSGNPGGRPKKRPISERYEKMADQLLPDDLRRTLKLEKGATYGDAVALRMFVAAIKGNSPAAKEVREAIEGRAAQRIELTGPGGEPLNPKDPPRPMRDFTPEQMAAITKLADRLERGQGEPSA